MTLQDGTLIDPSQIKPTKAGYDNLSDQIERGRFNAVTSGAAPVLYDEIVSTEDQTTFKITKGFYIVGDRSLQVFVNGQLMREGADNDYIEIDNTTIEFNYGLFENDVVVFRVAGGRSGPSVHERYLATAGQQVFELASTYAIGNDSLVVFINGAYQSIGIDYEETDGKTVTMVEPLDEGDIVVFRVEGQQTEDSMLINTTTTITYDSRKRVIKSETIGDGIHVTNEYYRDSQGRPERMVIKNAGYTTTKTYIWVGDQCVNILEHKVEGI